MKIIFRIVMGIILLVNLYVAIDITRKYQNAKKDTESLTPYESRKREVKFAWIDLVGNLVILGMGVISGASPVFWMLLSLVIGFKVKEIFETKVQIYEDYIVLKGEKIPFDSIEKIIYKDGQDSLKSEIIVKTGCRIIRVPNKKEILDFLKDKIGNVEVGIYVQLNK